VNWLGTGKMLIKVYLNKQTKQVGLQIGLGSCSMYKWMKSNVWQMKNIKRVSVLPEKTSWSFWNISETFHEIFHEIFHAKKIHEILHHYLDISAVQVLDMWHLLSGTWPPTSKVSGRSVREELSLTHGGYRVWFFCDAWWPWPLTTWP